MDDPLSLEPGFTRFPRSDAAPRQRPDLTGLRARVGAIDAATEQAAGWAFAWVRRAAHEVGAAGGSLRLPLGVTGPALVDWDDGDSPAAATEVEISIAVRSGTESGVTTGPLLREAGPARLRAEVTAGAESRELARWLVAELGRWWNACRPAAAATWEAAADRRDRWLADAAGRLWRGETPPAEPEELAFVIDQYRHRVLATPTHLFVGSAVERDDTAAGWRLCVTVESPWFGEGIRRLLAQLGAPPDRLRVRLLPEKAEPALPSRFAVVAVAHTLLGAEAGARDGAQTEVRRGEPVWVLDATADAVLIHSSDGYWGWVPRPALEWVDEARFGAALAGWGEPAEGKPDVRSALAALREQIRAAAAAAAGVPYVWGGRGPRGLDCSGFVQTAYAAAGLHLPRDAWQQALAGRLVGTRWARDWAQPLDLLFFAGRVGRITHVGLALGGGEYVHLALPEAQVSSLRPGDVHYTAELAEQLVLIKRILG